MTAAFDTVPSLKVPSTSTTMRAFVMESLDRVRFMDKPVTQPGPNDAIVKTTRALVCTSDSHTVHGAIGPRQNLTLGHEAVGVVHAVGSEVKYFKPGDRVVAGAITPDWGRSRLPGGTFVAISRAAGRLEVLEYQGCRICRALPR